jgi:4'-phosphopantetheinyl transferase
VREVDVGDGARLWLVRLDVADYDETILTLLSDDERGRASAYPGQTRGRRFVRARAALRAVIGELADLPPADVRFAYGRDGKPSLATPDAGKCALQFNLSHARELALIAVTHGRRIGVDLAWVDGDARLEHVAARYFSAPERSVFDAAAKGDRRAVFSRIWVRKEAYLKGRGEGISERIYDTDFSSTLGAMRLSAMRLSAMRLSAMRRSASVFGRRDQDAWEIRDVSGIDEGYVASMAIERADA